MAEERGLWLKIKTFFDKSEVEKETKDVITDAQRIANLSEVKLDLIISAAEAKAELKTLQRDLSYFEKDYRRSLKEGNRERATSARDYATLTRADMMIVQDELKKTQKEINKVDMEIQELSDTSTEANWILSKFKQSIANISAAAIAAKAIHLLTQKFNEFQQAQKTIVKATGVTWENLQKLTNDMLKVQGKVWQSQEEIAQAIWELNTRLWLSWEQLQNFTEKFLKFASVTGQDWQKAIEDTVQMFSIRGVSVNEQAEYLDKLTVASQKTGINVNELTNQLRTSAPALQELWLNLDDSISLLSNFEKAWIETSQVLASMKIAISNLVEWWATPSSALEEIVDRIQNAETRAEGLEIAFNTFGTRGWLTMYNAIKNGTFALDEMKEALNNTRNAVENTYKEMETLWEYLSRMWSWARASYVQWMNEWFQATRKVYHAVKDSLAPTLQKIWNTIQGLAEKYYNRQVQNNTLAGGMMKWIVEANKVNKKAEENKKIMNELNTTRGTAIEQKKKFDKVKIDDSQTRAEFEKDKQAAIWAMQAFQAALIAKEKYSNNTSSYNALMPYRVNDTLLQLNKDIYNAKFTKFIGTDGGVLWESLLGGWWGWWGKSKAEELLEAFDDELQKTRWDLNTLVDEHKNSYDDVVDEIEKVEKEYWKLKDKAEDTRKSLEKSLKDYNEQLEKTQKDAVTNLWQRYVDLKRDLPDANAALKNMAESMTSERLRDLQEKWYTEYYWYQLSDLIEIRDKLDEIELIEANTTEEQRKSTEFTQKTSKAQEILNSLKSKEAEIEQQKADAIEKQKIASAVMNQEIWKELIQTLTKNGEAIGTRYYDVTNEKREQIHNVDNIEYAKQLEEQAKELAKQKSQLMEEKDEELDIRIRSTSQKIQLEETFSKVRQTSVDKQKKGLDELTAKTQELINKRREYLTLGGEILHNAYGWSLLNGKVSVVGENWPEQIIARQSSYIQPRNASNSYSTVNSNNQTSSFSINGMQVNVGSIDEFLDVLKQKLTYRD